MQSAQPEKAQEKIDSGNVTDTPQAVTQRRQLEEVRLMMTIEANRRLMASGYSIDTTDLEVLVDALKKLEQEQNQKLLGNPTRRQRPKRRRFTMRYNRRRPRSLTCRRQCLSAM